MNRNVEIGKRFERRVAELFTQATGYRFFRAIVNRSSTRGGRAGVAGGDVICERADFVFCIEAKSHRRFSVESVLAGNTTLLDEFWKQTCAEASLSGKMPLLVARSGQREFAFFNASLVNAGTSHAVVHFNPEYKIAFMELGAFLQSQFAGV